MDSTTLVRERVGAGEKLLTRLRERALEVVAACWAKTIDDGQWYLYLVSPRVDTEGRVAVYKVVLDTLASMEGGGADAFERIGALDVKVLRPSQPLARGMLDLYRAWPNDPPAYHQDSVLGSVSVEGAYIYPAAMFAPPQPA